MNEQKEPANGWTVVVYSPLRCPVKKCRSTRLKNYGRNGRHRYHRCLICGKRFKSMEKDQIQPG